VCWCSQHRLLLQFEVDGQLRAAIHGDVMARNVFVRSTAVGSGQVTRQDIRLAGLEHACLQGDARKAGAAFAADAASRRVSAAAADPKDDLLQATDMLHLLDRPTAEGVCDTLNQTRLSRRPLPVPMLLTCHRLHRLHLQEVAFNCLHALSWHYPASRKHHSLIIALLEASLAWQADMVAKQEREPSSRS
jgi:hypothetical protein